MLIVDTCPRCGSVYNFVADTRYRMKFKCKWCGDRFTTPAKKELPFDEPPEETPIEREKEPYWFDEETED